MTPGPTLSPARWAELDPRVGEADTRGPLDASAPSVAHVYDHLRGGKDTFAADRELAEWALRKSPIVGSLVQANRGFLDDAAGLLATKAGLRRFLDSGRGSPRPVNVGDVVRRTDPSCRVVYIDNDPMVVAHGRALLAVHGRSVAYEGDVRDPVALLGDPEPNPTSGRSRTSRAVFQRRPGRRDTGRRKTGLRNTSRHRPYSMIPDAGRG
ncbi:hypothetical protein GCM10022254_32970 [Actinomadura meridiana]|uniref:Uncharacterized protein n=1 Tax=Actinomadura meridiana TaxID=559626 RepID=A0ABP8C2U3_9ACTN